LSTAVQQFDIIISGSGMVGASLAHALTGQGLRIALIDANPYNSRTSPSFDDRAIALSFGTVKILRALSLWDVLRPHAEAIKKIHVSEQGQFGFARLNSEEENVEALGYVVTATELGKVLLAPLAGLHDVEQFCPAQLQSFEVSDDCVSVDLQMNNQALRLQAKLLVAADGGNSTVRQQLGIDVKVHDYGQSAIVSNVETSSPHDNVAFERFTEQGPVALLPMTDKRSALVYTVENDQLEDNLHCADEVFLERLQQRFGFRLGQFVRIGQRNAYELLFKEVAEHVRPRIALIGNAAHTVHPIAGQGFNLGIRDVAVLADVILEAIAADRDIGSIDNLQAYAKWRKQDHRDVMFATDSMVRMFANKLPMIRKMRNLGILAIDMLPGGRSWFSRQAMGLSGRLPRLARGLPLHKSQDHSHVG